MDPKSLSLGTMRKKFLPDSVLKIDLLQEEVTILIPLKFLFLGIKWSSNYGSCSLKTPNAETIARASRQ